MALAESAMALAESAATGIIGGGIPMALLITSSVFSVYLVVASNVLSSETCHDCPRWSWLASLPFQTALLPALWLWAFYSQELPLLEWILAGWDTAGASSAVDLRRLWLCVFFGYIAKDCVLYKCMTFIYWLHHFVCFAITLGYLYLDPPCVFVTGAMLCELGSASQSFYYVADTSPTYGRFAWWNHCILMTASNVASVALVVLLMLQHEHPLGSRLTFSIVTVILMEERQRACIANLRGWKPPSAAAAAAKKAS